MLKCNRLWALGPPCLLVLYTYLYYTFCLLCKGTIVYFITWEIQYIHSVFLTWYQSHCSNLFLRFTVLSLLVFSATSTSPASKLSASSPNCSAAVRGPQDWISTARSTLSTAKDHCLLESVHCELRLRHQKYHFVDLKSIYSTPLESSLSDYSCATMHQSKFRRRYFTRLIRLQRCSNLDAAITNGIVLLQSTWSTRLHCRYWCHLWHNPCHISPCWHHLCLRQYPTSAPTDFERVLTVNFDRTLTVDFDLELTFCSLGAPYPVFRVYFIFAVHFCIFCF